MKHLWAAALAAVFLLGLAGCAGLGAPEPSPSPSPAPPTPTPTAEPTPTPTPAPVVDPLTGQMDAYVDGHRPAAVTLRTLTGAAPWRGIASAKVLIAAVSEGNTAGMTALYAQVDDVPQVGPVGPGRDVTLQLALPMNAVAAHIDKNIYTSNLFNLIPLQDLDGYHVGKVAFRFDDARYAQGARAENCWYTDAEHLRAGLEHYDLSARGVTQPLFWFAAHDAAKEAGGAQRLEIGFSHGDWHVLSYDPALEGYCLALSQTDAASAQPVVDENDQATPCFTNVLVLYASSGIKDDGYTRAYDMTGGDGLYLTQGAWQPIRWSKEDATAPLLLEDTEGGTLAIEPGSSYIAVWGGYYGQSLTLTDADGASQALPPKPALLDSGVTDEAAAAAEQAYQGQLERDAAQARLDAALIELANAQAALATAQSTPEPEDDAAAQAAVDAAQAAVDIAQQELDALPAQQAAPPAEGDGALPQSGEPVPEDAAQAAADAAQAAS